MRREGGRDPASPGAYLPVPGRLLSLRALSAIS